MSYLECSVRLYLQLLIGGLVSYLGCSISSPPPVVCRRARVLFVFIGVQYKLFCAFVLICLVYNMLPVSLTCPFLIATSVSSTFI